MLPVVTHNILLLIANLNLYFALPKTIYREYTKLWHWIHSITKTHNKYERLTSHQPLLVTTWVRVCKNTHEVISVWSYTLLLLHLQALYQRRVFWIHTEMPRKAVHTSEQHRVCSKRQDWRTRILLQSTTRRFREGLQLHCTCYTQDNT